MSVASLLRKRVVFLSGKGGVGKSACGLALGLLGSGRGKRVLLVEIDAPLEATRYLSAEPAGSTETELRPGLFTVNLDPPTVMAEWVKRTAKLDLLVRPVLNSPIYHRFFAAAPGLKELMVLGKIMSLEQERQHRSKKPRYDQIIVDAPSTGHGLSLLKVPGAASRAIPVGPVGKHARQIDQALRNPALTALGIVAIPEEMAVIEALELHEAASEELGMSIQVILLNQSHGRRLKAAQEARVLDLAGGRAKGRLARGVSLESALAAGRRHIRRRKLSAFYLRRLRRQVETPVVPLPYVFSESFDEAAIGRLAAALADA